jgi:hypothetical protein maviaA2_03522
MKNYLQADANLIRSCLPENVSVPDDADNLFLLYAVLLRAKGADVEIDDVHDAWSAWMSQKDSSHDSIRPFRELDPATQSEDVPFWKAIRTAAKGSRPPTP